MANDATPITGPESAQEEHKASASIRLIIADTEPIFRVGIRKVVALEDDIRVVAQTETLPQTLASLNKFPTDVLLFGTMMSPNPADAVTELMKGHENLRIVLVSPELGEEQTVDFLRRGVRGIVTRSVSPDLLVKCVKKVHVGETWLDNQGVNWVIEAYRAQASQLTGPRPKVRLTEKELLIIAGVTQGMKNKDIAQEVGTTEQVVKNYLRKVYDKLGVSDRLELALYCMHHRLLEGLRKNQQAVAQDSQVQPQVQQS
ncbi:MAG TPA: response regulator transcription factor [Terriglobales bacterium]|nr:response regulator transcription factor [Terriglobales bacterium]